MVAGEGSDITNLPQESSPPLEEILKKRKVIDTPVPKDDNKEDPNEGVLDDEPKVLIYHTHSYESFLPHLPEVTDKNLAKSSELNITNVGDYLGKELNNLGINTIVDTTDIGQELKSRGLQHKNAYELSREIVTNILAEHDSIEYIIDIHRDSLRAEDTIATIDGEEHARLLFVIGEAVPGFEQNETMAKELHVKLEENAKGISRFVLGKGRNEGNGVYNQDLFKKAMLVEFGGVDNHMDDLQRSADVFAEVLREYINDIEGN
ncbi:stage II sporulation protein P [Shouchella plakortidis]|uniref:Stage II sporulation protein P n=1 Tax=Alkalicoccobacillus plakortidis TaxID=444060 RepID=A0ABT0XNC5_9BACI|nr:stage II sporulation protein P [Alkalicoccobacillus plakortidis]